MSSTKTITQGGQVSLHNLRMINQVMGTTVLISLGITLLFLLGKFWLDTSSSEKYVIGSYYYADLKLSVPLIKPERVTQNFKTSTGRTRVVRSLDVVNHPQVKSTVDRFEDQQLQNLYYSLWMFFISLFGVCGIWYYRGKSISKKEILSGGEVVPVKELTKLLKKEKKASDLELSGLPLVKGSELKHILIVGTTGAGKTNTFHHLLPQIRKRGQKAVIVDTTGVFVEKYYNPETDVILNPLDQRSREWSLWRECSNDIQIEDLASSMIPQTHHDPFWVDSSRSLFSETVKILKGKKEFSTKTLLEYAIQKPLSKIQSFYSESSVAALVDISADKTAASIRLNLSTCLRALHMMKDGKDSFSIRDWIRDDSQTGWLFLLSMPDQRETMRPLLSAWLSVSINSLMSCSPNYDRRVWFIIDEKQSLNKIEALPKALAEIRKYGGCIVSGLQNISQIDNIYGHEIRKTMASLYNTKIFFRSPDTDTAQWISKTIGENEVMESSEGISFGAHQMRDGVSINEHLKTKPTIPYSELMSLKDLCAFVKLPEDYPVAKLTFSYKEIKPINAPFIEKKIVAQLVDKAPEIEEEVELERAPNVLKVVGS